MSSQEQPTSSTGKRLAGSKPSTVIGQVLNLFSREERRRLGLLVSTSAVMAFVELASVFSVLPFLALASKPDALKAMPLLAGPARWLGLADNREVLMAAGLATMVAIVATNAISMAVGTFRTHTCWSLVRGISERLFRAYLARPYIYFLGQNTSVLGKDLHTEAWRFQARVLDPASILITRGLSLLLVVGGLVVYDWRGALLVFIVFGGFYAASYHFLRHRLTNHGRRLFEADERRQRTISEALLGIKETQLFGREEWFAEAFSRDSSIVTAAHARVQVYALTPRFLIEGTTYALLVAVVLFVIWRGGELADVLPILGLYVVAGVRLMPALQAIYQSIVALRSGRPALERLISRFEEVQASAAPAAFPVARAVPLPLRKRLVLRDVGFAYPGKEERALDEISLEIPAFSCVGISGPSGAGKTTLADVCLGLLEPCEGVVEVDGTTLDASNRRRWMASVGYVPQQIYLTDASIAENIAFGVSASEIDRSRVEASARLANLHDFIVSQLSQGYETQVGERGIRLSGGQRQRLAIARALYHDPQVLMFDEATSALDSETEEAIVESIQSLAHRKTIILIAHRTTTLRHCDRIFVLREGRLEKTCRYSELEQRLTAAPTVGATR